MQGVDGVLETRVGYALGEKPSGIRPSRKVSPMRRSAITADTPKRSRLSLMRKNLSDRNSQGILLYHRPTSLGRQGMDIGIQYRTGIYSLTEKQRQTAQAFLDTLQKDYKQPIMIENLPLRQLFKRRRITRNILKKIPMAIAISILRKLRRRRRRKRKAGLIFR